MHVLITGGAGFIGSHLAEFHLKRGDRVHVVDDLSTGRLENITALMDHDDFIFDKADILIWGEFEKAIAWADRIYHMAAVVGLFKVLAEPISVLATNISGCERLLRFLHKSHWNTKVILASSSEVYGNRPGRVALNEKMELLVSPDMNTRWNYSLSKLADEALGLSYARQYGMDITIVRFFNVVGPNQTGKYGMVVPRFVKQAVHGEAITVFGDGKQVRAFMDVRDAVDILDRLSISPKSKGEVVNVGCSGEITIEGLAKLVKEHAKSDSPITFTPYKEAYGDTFDEIYHRKADLTKLKELIPYEPKWSLEKTLDDLILRQTITKDS